MSSDIPASRQPCPRTPCPRTGVSADMSGFLETAEFHKENTVLTDIDAVMPDPQSFSKLVLVN